jgi:hypothetical protein
MPMRFHLLLGDGRTDSGTDGRWGGGGAAHNEVPPPQWGCRRDAPHHRRAVGRCNWACACVQPTFGVTESDMC